MQVHVYRQTKLKLKACVSDKEDIIKELFTDGEKEKMHLFLSENEIEKLQYFKIAHNNIRILRNCKLCNTVV